jgi:UDP-N-acetylglucosamine 1-carboxyvinyltransferase
VDKLVIEGGARLQGSVRICGAKNSVLPVMAAALLSEQPLCIPNVPQLHDVGTMAVLLRELGAAVERNADGSVEICAEGPLSDKAPWETVRKMRASICVLGPLLGRMGRADVSLPGGCVFGVRPIDVHLKGFEALGAKVRVEHGFIVAQAPQGGLRGAEIFLGTAFGSSVTGTMNVLMAAVLAHGRTVIHYAACEPEVEDLCRCLVTMGAKIEGIGSPMLVIEGVAKLGGATHAVIPDRIEAGTYLSAGSMTGGQVRVTGMRPTHLSAYLDRMREAGLPYECGPDWVETQPLDGASLPSGEQVGSRAGSTRGNGSGADFPPRPRPTDVTTQTYPGFPTDLQAQWMAQMCFADGVSVINEVIYPDRYMHVAELARLGAQVRRQGTTAIVQGKPSLSGAKVMASDLRASAALVLAGLAAQGKTEVYRVYHIDRGYEKIEQRLIALGAKIKREKE